jgi:AcrR family transcriptional regulator
MVSRRDRMAEQTRSEILLAARRLFGERGFAATSIADIARAAEVSPQTIYDRVGSKAGLLVALVDVIDEQVGANERIPRVFAATSGRVALREFVGVTRLFQEHAGDFIAALFGAAAFEPDLGVAAQEGRRRHREGAGQLMAHLQRLGALRPGVDPQVAAAVVTALTQHEAWLELVREMSWDEAEDAIVDALGRALLAGRAR